MIGRSLAMPNGQAMSDGFSEIGLGGLDGIRDTFASGEMRRDGRGKGTSRAVRMGRVDVFTLEDVEEPSVIEQIGPALFLQMAPFDEDIGATELMNDFGGTAGIGQRGDLDPRKLLRFMHVRRDEQSQRKERALESIDGIRLQQRLPACIS